MSGRTLLNFYHRVLARGLLALVVTIVGRSLSLLRVFMRIRRLSLRAEDALRDLLREPLAHGRDLIPDI